MKKTCVGLAVILALASGLLGNGLNLNGFGARAASMGGAFVAEKGDIRVRNGPGLSDPADSFHPSWSSRANG